MHHAVCLLPVQAELTTTRGFIENNKQQMDQIDETLEQDVRASRDLEQRERQLTQIVDITEEHLSQVVSKTVIQELQEYLEVEEECTLLSQSTSPEWQRGSLAEKARHARTPRFVHRFSSV